MKRKDKNKMTLPPAKFHKWLQELLKHHNEKIDAGRTSYIGELALLATVIYYEKHPDYLDARENPPLPPLTPEQKRARSRRQAIYLANRIANMTPEQLQEFREKQRKAMRDYYHNRNAEMTPEELEAFRAHKRKVTSEYQRTHREKCNAKKSAITNKKAKSKNKI